MPHIKLKTCDYNVHGVYLQVHFYTEAIDS